jgi:2-octaprenyl-6-methoxyphenol hydroxylase
MHNEYDIVIVGGGMVGATLACALSDVDCRIAIVERFPYQSEQQPSYDDRSIALAYGSRKIFEGMGLWEQLRPHVEPIHRIHISDRGHFGVTRLDCQDEGTDALGYVVENRAMGRVLNERLSQLGHVDFICPASVENLLQNEDFAELQINRNGQLSTIHARLVVAADGTQSTIRELLDIPVTKWEYGQTAIIANVTPQKMHHNMAYERFTDTGPLAMLPMTPCDGEQRCSLVCVVRDEQVDDMMSLSDENFLAFLQQRFGYRLGKLLKAGSRHAYPLTLIRARDHIGVRVAMIGNAAHTLHPIAGQGYNLGIRDVAVLAELIADALSCGEDPGALSVLRQYEGWRKRDHRSVIAFTDGLARIFSNPLPPVKLARNLGLILTDMSPSIKTFLSRRTMGLAGHLPRLARGLPLLR